MDENIQRRVITTTTTTTRQIIRHNKVTVSGNTSFTTSSTTVTAPVTFSKTISSQSVELPASPKSLDNTTGLQITGLLDMSSPHIEHIDINSQHTVEELDEKRENERVYEYLLRLTEVRNWLKDCLHSDDIAKETELEQNLSNGVLLARLAHSFAPNIVSLSKIFDINQSRYYKEGHPCYRHTDNISLWKRAIRSVHFPEILIPDTVDIYEGRNIKTVFSLFALAKHLHRLRRGPAIRREDNVQFSPTALDDVRERLKHSDLSLFGNIDEILATTPGDLEAHMKAVMQLNNSMDNKETLLECLKWPDTGILYVNDALIDRYQNGLLKKRQTLNKNEFLNREQIQSVITEINDAEALKHLEYVLQGRKTPEVSEVNVILDDLQQEDILRSAGPLYAEELYKIRRTQSAPLTLEQVEKILKVVNMCMRVRFYATENDERGIYDALSSEPLGMKVIIRPELKSSYKDAICEEYKKDGKNSVLMSEQLRDIVERVNNGKFTVEGLDIEEKKISSPSVEIQDITAACQKDDPEALFKALKNIKGAREDLVLYYLEALKRIPDVTENNVEAIVSRINENIQEIRTMVHNIELSCQADDLNSLARALENVKSVKTEYMPHYRNALKNGHYITIEEIEEIIEMVNQTIEADRIQVSEILSASQKGDLNSLSKALKPLKYVSEKLMPNYQKALMDERYNTIEEVEKIITQVNEKYETSKNNVNDIASACEQNNPSKLAKALHGIKDVREDLMDQYLKALINTTYSTMEEVEMIISRVNQSAENERKIVEAIATACQADDYDRLLEAIHDFKDLREEFIPYYMFALKKRPISIIKEVEEIIRTVNHNIDIAVSNGRETVQLNMLIANGKKDEAAKLLATSWQKVVRHELLSEYVAWLTEEIVIRKKKWESKTDAKNGGYLPEQFPDGVLYVNIDNYQIKYLNPNRTVEWMLTRLEIERINEMINNKHVAGKKHESEEEIKQEAARKIQRWWRRQQFLKNLDELRTSNRPRLRVVRRFAPMLLQTRNDQREDEELEGNRAYSTKLINANRYLEEQLTDLDERIAKMSTGVLQPVEVQKFLENVRAEASQEISRDIFIDKDRMKWNPYEIIFFYLQTKPEYLSRLMAKHSNLTKVLSDLFRRFILPIYNYGTSNREMSLIALLLKNYLQEEIKKLNDPIDFRNTQSCVLLQILMELYGRTESQLSQIAELNKMLCNKKCPVFNLNPISIYESVTCKKPKNIDEAMSNATVVKVLNESKQFLTRLATAYANVIFGNAIDYPNIIRYLAICAQADLKNQFPLATDIVLMQAVGAWLFKSCWEGEIIAASTNENGKENENPTLAIRKLISKFIEYGILNFGYGVEKYWLNSLNEKIGEINAASLQHLTKFVLQRSPMYNYNVQDEYWDKYGSRRPVLHIRMLQLHTIQRKLQNNINEIIPEKNSRLYRLIADTLPPDDKAEYVTLYLRPFATDDDDNREDLFRRTMRYVEQCLLSGCPGNSLTQLLARHTLQKEEENFQALPHQADDPATLDDTKRNIAQQLSTLEKLNRVTPVNNYQDIVTAIAKDINHEQNYRKNRFSQLAFARQLVKELENVRRDYCKRLEAYDDYFKELNDGQGSTEDSAGNHPRLVKKRSTRRQQNNAKELIANGIITAIYGYPSLQGCDDVTLDISTTQRPGILLFKISEPMKQALFQTEMDWQQLERIAMDPNGTLCIAEKITVNAQKLMAYINQTIYAKN